MGLLYALDVARVYLSYPALCRSDLRREYGISKDDVTALEACEFVELVGCLSPSSRIWEHFSAARVESEKRKPIDPETWADRLRRHPGAVEIIEV